MELSLLEQQIVETVRRAALSDLSSQIEDCKRRIATLEQALPRHYSIAQVAEFLSCSYDKAYDLYHSGAFGDCLHKRGSKIMVSAQALLSYKESLAVRRKKFA